MMATSKTRLRTRSRLPSVERLEARRLMAVGFDQVALPAGDVATGLLATAGDGSVWMTAEAGTGSTAQPEILRLDPATGLTSVAASLPAGTDPIGLTKGPDGSIWMISARADGTGLVTDFGPNGTLTEGLPDAPTSFAFGADGDLYATAQHTNADGSQNGEILRLDPATIRVTTFPLTDSGKSLGSMTLGPDGNVWFAEHGRGAIRPDRARWHDHDDGVALAGRLGRTRTWRGELRAFRQNIARFGIRNRSRRDGRAPIRHDRP